MWRPLIATRGRKDDGRPGLRWDDKSAAGLPFHPDSLLSAETDVTINSIAIGTVHLFLEDLDIGQI